ncbi:hypothetical protein [Streptomyces cylindrosporus]|uniref:Uncharacterized protein n=1 Tax=Streptomyces cylindrosporus TaxID=2927583 RepID=A0ABS9YKC6_9ACTN|nr:hypothetical protein [Streptomyces cylindrosporus]MCI3277620.1 hypothetical protein [Streptomyces cylindrosporus]
MSSDRTTDWTPVERLHTIVAQEINDVPAEELIKAATDDVLRAWAARIRAVGKAKGWSTWAADYMDPDTEFTDIGTPPVEEIEKAVAEGAEKDTSGGNRPAEGESTPGPELLKYASSFEFPRAEAHKPPLLMQRVHGQDDAWAILDQTDHCWSRDNGGQWVACLGGPAWLEQQRSVLFTFGHAWTLAERIAATDVDGKCWRNVVFGEFSDHFFKKGALTDAPQACIYCGLQKPEESVTPGAGQ